MANNEDFLQVIQQAFHKYLQTSPRSNEKLIILHGKISNDLQELLPDYTITRNWRWKEQSINGRYLDKKVDIKINKYVKLSHDNADVYMHTPNKTLLVMTKIPEINLTIIKTKQDYINNYKEEKVDYSNKFIQKCLETI